MLLHQKVFDRCGAVFSRLNQLGSVADNNPLDKFLLVAVPDAVDILMDAVVLMDVDELNWNNWWKKGFIALNSRNSSKTLEHSGLVDYATELATEFYNGRRLKGE